jgi:hypothetical protein
MFNQSFPARADHEAPARGLVARCLARLAAAFALCVLTAAAGGSALAQTQDRSGGELAKENTIERPPAINIKPFEDITLKGKELFEQGKLNLDGPLDVTATATLNDDGTFNIETVRINWNAGGDENNRLLAQQLVMALSQSKLFGALRGAKDVRLALRLDSQNVSAKIASELASEEEAARYATVYTFLLSVGRQDKRGTPEGELYDGLNLANDGKLLLLSFEMRKDLAGKIIADMLAKRAAHGGY